MTRTTRCLMCALVCVIQVAWSPSVSASDQHCPYFESGSKQVYWGDLHVHSGYSLDAWGYGTSATPAQAFAFARGGVLELANSTEIQLDRPLDFMAVTDHAEWFNLMHICTDPEWSDAAYCDTMTTKNTPQLGSEVFADYVIPTITKASPVPTELCAANPEHCQRMQTQQWHRIQVQGNQANDPCNFTSFLGYEWSATGDFSHNHRNIIFANSHVTTEAIDYMRFPTPAKLWSELDRQCLIADGCEVLAIPHNTNMGDGKSFDVESESADILKLRSRYETLVEIHQGKGNSECLPAFGATDEDCSFEIYLTKNSRPTARSAYSEGEWERMRSSHVRGLLLRGIAAYERSNGKQHPLQLGIIGSTDNHAAAGGFVEEDAWLGSVFGVGDFDRRMTRRAFNPGGLVAVWAEENTRSSIFAALKRREVYATSGPRIRAKLSASTQAIACGEAREGLVPMGGEMNRLDSAPHFLVQAQFDRVPIQSVEIIKGEIVAGQAKESVQQIWHDQNGGLDVCVSWQDLDFQSESPAFWYVRVLQAPTPRWSAHDCQREGRCDEYPDANVAVRERAWTSPIWYLPEL